LQSNGGRCRQMQGCSHSTERGRERSTNIHQPQTSNGCNDSNASKTRKEVHKQSESQGQGQGQSIDALGQHFADNIRFISKIWWINRKCHGDQKVNGSADPKCKPQHCTKAAGVMYVGGRSEQAMVWNEERSSEIEQMKQHNHKNNKNNNKEEER
jgi:hypothetical protein